MKTSPYFSLGFKAMLPITTGVIPFGAVMGTVCYEAHLSIFQTVTMNVLVYSGAAQLAAVDLMSKNAAIAVVVATALAINLRFLLYSAALSPALRGTGFWTKLFCAHTVTDQSYAVMTASLPKTKTNTDAAMFYMGTAICMLIVWHSSVIAGFIFGNFAPASWSLDYAVPISFLALVIPTLKNRKYVIVALVSSVLSVLLYSFPLKMGLIITAAISISLAAVLTQKRSKS